MVARIGPLATYRREPRQARKGAAAAVARVPRCGWFGLPPSLFDTTLRFALPRIILAYCN